MTYMTGNAGGDAENLKTQPPVAGMKTEMYRLKNGCGV